MKKFFALAVLLLLMMASACAAAVSDAQGNEITFDQAPQRVVSLLGSYGKVWQEAGGTLVGATEDAVDPDSDEIANLGSHSQPNMELLWLMKKNA